MFYNPYKVLGCSSSSSIEEIKGKYRELSKTYHPDNPKTGDVEKFQEIKKAWEYIKENHVAVPKRKMWRHKTIFSVYQEN